MSFGLLLFLLQLYLVIGALYSLLFVTTESSQKIISNVYYEDTKYLVLSHDHFTVFISLFFFCVFTVVWLPVIVLSFVGGYHNAR